MPWSRPFDDPIPLPRRRQLVTLKDGADYIMKLPNAGQNLEEWQAAVGYLIGAAEGRDAHSSLINPRSRIQRPPSGGLFVWGAWL
jgi:hypothetical protein